MELELKAGNIVPVGLAKSGPTVLVHNVEMGFKFIAEPLRNISIKALMWDWGSKFGGVAAKLSCRARGASNIARYTIS